MNIRKLAAAFLLLASLGASGATVLERSPFAQGLWWNPQRPGHGFEIFNVGTETMVLWYTYEVGGKPIWYSAQGTLGATSWPLMKHQWSNGRISASQSVGTVALRITTPESMIVDYTVAGSPGTWTIEPFRVAGASVDVDHSGAYFHPASSGWGLSLLHQGDVLGGILYTYDAQGSPTWYAGFERGSRGTITVYSTRGSCPTCTYTAPSNQRAGNIAVDRTSEWGLTFANELTVPTAPGANVHLSQMVQLSRPASSRPADRALAHFTTDLALKAFLDTAMLEVSARNYGGVDFSPAPAGASTTTSFSTTNLQEAGVDEADVVKTDGRRIFTFATDLYERRVAQLRIANVAADGSAVSIQGNVPLAAGDATYLSGGLYARTDQLIAVTGPAAGGYFPAGTWAASGAWMEGKTAIEIFDTSGTGLPVSSWRASVDGYLVSSRRIGDRLYVVARHVPYVAGFSYGTSSYPGSSFYESARASNRALLATTPLSALLPNISVNGGARVPLVDAASVFVPPQGARPVAADMILVYAIDLAQKRLAQSMAILSTTDTVYVSGDNLYVATSRYNARAPSGSLLPEPVFYTTEIHQIGLTPSGMSLVGSGAVEGMVNRTTVDKAAFRFSEHQGKLRIVTSSGTMWGTNSPNRLTIVEPSASATGILRTVSVLPNAARPEPIGKPGEMLYATRFAGDRLYAVTFRQIDPLYVVNLADALDPKITGALELPGFSEYLHPLPNGLLLGFGKDAVAAGVSGDGGFAWFQGLRMSLFDVSTGMPRELQNVTIGKRGSDSALIYEHRAFSTLAKPDGTLAIAFPARIHDGVPYAGSGPSASYPWVQSGVARLELRGSTPANAQLVQQPMMVTETAATRPTSAWRDSAVAQGRPILFGDNTIYIGHGKIWHRNAAGVTTGPF